MLLGAFMKKTSLVLMAAGLGSRFGGTKQLAQIGPDGETILDYTIRDARTAGITKAVIIVRKEIIGEVRAHIEQVHGALDDLVIAEDILGMASLAGALANNIYNFSAGGCCWVRPPLPPAPTALPPPLFVT